MTKTMDREQRNMLLTHRRIAEAVTSIINDDCPDGAPDKSLYILLSQYLDREEYQSLMRLLVEAGRITRRGDRYYPREQE